MNSHSHNEDKISEYFRIRTHSTILQVLEALGGKKKEGICHGLAFMGMQAFLAGDKAVEEFNQRIDRIMREAKSAVLENLKDTHIETLPTDNQYYINVFRQHYRKKFNEWEKRAQSAGGFNNLFSKLAEHEKQEWDMLKSIEVFVQGADLYFDPSSFIEPELRGGLFEKDQVVFNQDANIVAPLLSPVSLDLDDNKNASGGMRRVEVNNTPCNKCFYFENHKDLQAHLARLTKGLLEKEIAQRVAFTISSGDHTMCIGFDPQKKEYFFIDANRFPIRPVKDLNALALLIAKSFAPAKIPPSEISPLIVNIQAYTATTDPVIQNNIKEAFDEQHVAAEQRYQIPKKVIEDVANENHRDKRNGYSLLNLAIISNDLVLVQKIMAENRNLANLNNPSKAESTLLSLAANHNNIEIISYLLENNANPNIYGKNDVPPLCSAINNHNYDLASLLLAHNANPKLKDENGYTPLHYAVLKNNFKLASLLLKHGAKIDEVSIYGQSVFDFVLKTKNKKIFLLLLLTKLNPDKISENVEISLQLIAMLNNQEFSSLAEEYYKDPGMKNNVIRLFLQNKIKEIESKKNAYLSNIKNELSNQINAIFQENPDSFLSMGLFSKENIPLSSYNRNILNELQVKESNIVSKTNEKAIISHSLEDMASVEAVLSKAISYALSGKFYGSSSKSSISDRNCLIYDELVQLIDIEKTVHKLQAKIISLDKKILNQSQGCPIIVEGKKLVVEKSIAEFNALLIKIKKLSSEDEKQKMLAEILQLAEQESSIFTASHLASTHNEVLKFFESSIEFLVIKDNASIGLTNKISDKNREQNQIVNDKGKKSDDEINSDKGISPKK
jgi:ankyrin repeat protein